MTDAAAWQVYILECADSSLYTGITKDLQSRLACHNDGSGAKYTRGRLPVRAVYTENVADRSSALQRELEIKGLSRTAKLDLINVNTRQTAAD
jgi:predicted GIY-YIG superfamily endonuclease